MLKLNKLSIILFSSCLILSSSLFAQSEKTTSDRNEEGKIVMTEAELTSFLNTIADARRTQLEERKRKQSKAHLQELRSKYESQSELGNRTSRNEGISNEEIMNELRYLNQRIDNLRRSNASNAPSMSRDNSTIIMPSGNAAAPIAPRYQGGGETTTVVPSANTEEKNERIDNLESMIDSLKNARNGKSPIVPSNNWSDSLNVNNSKLNALRRQMDSLQLQMRKVQESAVKETDSGRKSYFKEQVFFDNDSDQLRANYFPYIQDVTQVLMKYPEAKVLLEGWASTKGNSTYNKQLSMRRAESVERTLIQNGIDSSRIITAFRGEDKSSSEQQARRVDMAIVLN